MNISSVPRPRAAARAWGHHFGRALVAVRAQVLRSVMAEIEAPTVADLLAHLGEEVEAYDPRDPARVRIQLGDLCGHPGRGPEIGEFVTALEALEVVGAVLNRHLSTIVEGWVC